MVGRVFVTRPLFQETLEALRKDADVIANLEERILPKAELIERLREADGVITLITDTIDREVLERCPRLKVVANFGVGYNHVDVNAATDLGVAVTNTPGVLTQTTADFAWTLLMAAARRIAEADRFVRAGKFKAWGPTMMLGYDIFGKTLGLVGLGRIGQAMAHRARGFNMKTIFYDAEPISGSIIQELNVERVSLEELYRRSDFISLHVPLLPETEHLLNDKTFAMMKPTCVVVNSSRGPVVDEKALVRALNSGKIAAAALDVFEREPEIEPELFEMDNVVLAPHIASASYETRLKMSLMAAGDLVAVLKGQQPENLVNADVWDRRRQ